MAIMGEPTISALRIANGFRFTVAYTIMFQVHELNFPEGFAESMALFESDEGEVFGGSDDHYFNMPIRTFNPQTTETPREWTFDLTDSQLNTELGGEEIYAAVHFRRNRPQDTSQVKRTPIFPVSSP